MQNVKEVIESTRYKAIGLVNKRKIVLADVLFLFILSFNRENRSAGNNMFLMYVLWPNSQKSPISARKLPLGKNIAIVIKLTMQIAKNKADRTLMNKLGFLLRKRTHINQGPAMYATFWP